MNKKVVIIILVIIVGGIIINIYHKENGASRIYKKYQYPNEDVYGKELYSEIDYDCSEEESKIGEVIVARAFQVAEYTGTV